MQITDLIEYVKTVQLALDRLVGAMQAMADSQTHARAQDSPPFNFHPTAPNGASDICQTVKPQKIPLLKKEEDTMKYKGHKITLRKDGRWQAKFLSCGKYVYVYGHTQRECYLKLKKRYETKDVPKVMSVKEWFNYWLRTYRYPLKALSTARKDDNNTQKIIRAFGSLPLNELTADKIQEFLNNVNGDRQREHMFTVFSTALKKAVQLDKLDKSPMYAVEIKSYEPEERLILSRCEEELFIQAMSDSEYAHIFALALFEGLRPGELAAFRRSDIYGEYLHVREALDLLFNVKAPKTKAGKRDIPIFKNFLPFVDKFTECRQGNTDKLRDEFNVIRDKLGFDKRLSLYSLRHTFITRCAESGIPPKILQKWAGHKTIKITLQYYTHVSREWEQAATQKIDENAYNFDIFADNDFDTF